jgi:hypothetical protein
VALEARHVAHMLLPWALVEAGPFVQSAPLLLRSKVCVPDAWGIRQAGSSLCFASCSLLALATCGLRPPGHALVCTPQHRTHGPIHSRG